jgi:hypothetical protein
MSLFELVVIRPKEEPKVLKTGMTKKEAEAEFESWKMVYNADVFYEPVPKLKIRPMSQEG